MSRTFEYFKQNGLLEPEKWDEDYEREYEIWKSKTFEQLNNKYDGNK